LGAPHVHEHVQAGQSSGESQIAFVVLDREHEAADRVPLEFQLGAHRGQHERPAHVRQQPPFRAHAQAHDVLVEQLVDRQRGGQRFAPRHRFQQWLVVLNTPDLPGGGTAGLAFVDQVGYVLQRVDDRVFARGPAQSSGGRDAPEHVDPQSARGITFGGEGRVLVKDVIARERSRVG